MVKMIHIALLMIIPWSVQHKRDGTTIVVSWPSAGYGMKLCTATPAQWKRMGAAPCHDVIPFPVPKGLR